MRYCPAFYSYYHQHSSLASAVSKPAAFLPWGCCLQDNRSDTRQTQLATMTQMLKLAAHAVKNAPSATNSSSTSASRLASSSNRLKALPLS